MFQFLHQPAAQLASSYAELEAVDEALREAERELKEAHLAYASREGPRPDAIYERVVKLREESRQLLDDLADLFLREDDRPGESDAQGA